MITRVGNSSFSWEFSTSRRRCWISSNVVGVSDIGRLPSGVRDRGTSMELRLEEIRLRRDNSEAFNEDCEMLLCWVHGCGLNVPKPRSD
jgi:hypothetical protein